MRSQPDPKPASVKVNTVRAYLARNPNDGRAWFTLAQMLAHDPDNPELRQAIGRAIQLLPDNYQVWLLAAKMQLPGNGYTAVLNWLDDSARENPLLAAPQLASASIYASRDVAGALLRYRGIIEAFPQDTRGHVLMAQVLNEKGDFTEAARSIEQALKLQAESAEYWSMLARCRLMAGQHEAAISAASRALELDDKRLDALEARAEANRKALLWESALDDFEMLKQHRPDDPKLLNKIGVCLIRLERFEPAETHFKKALLLDPDFALAKLNIGLLCAVRMQTDEAVSCITKVLEDPVLDDASRASARITLDVLQEHKRLAPYLREAVRTGSMSELHHALQQGPASLLQPDRKITDKLAELAVLCRDFPFNPDDFRYTADTACLPFLEACAQCKINSDPALMRELHKVINNSTQPGSDRRNAEIKNALRVIAERRRLAADVLRGVDGEAWLRYWHARLLDGTPDRLPGQYKAIPNTIGHLMPPTPERVAGTYRSLLAELLPDMPGGLASAVFMLVAVSLIHGFGDGNGRLSRFLLSWECESAGLEAIVIPVEFRLQVARALQTAILEGELETLVAVLKEAHIGTGTLLQQLNEFNDHRP